MKFIKRIAIAIAIALLLCELGFRFAVSHVQAAPSQVAKSIVNQVLDQRYLNADMQYEIYDVSLPGYTIKDSIRLTTNQPLRWTRTVWLYGSSSVWGAFVDDGYTIASYLQRLFNERGLSWRVVNMGQPSMDITLERYWLRRSDIAHGDVVIFIDGGVDLKDSLNRAHADWIGASLPCQLSQRVGLLLLSMWCESVTSGTVPQQFVASAELIEFPRYWHDIDLAQKTAVKMGATYYHFMQPFPVAFPSGYDDYSRMYRSDPVLHINSVDFIDDLHYTPSGHAALARAIYAAIWQTF